MKALGLIEVNGYLAGVEAADAALKAASVTLIALEKVKAGITNVQITGDVGAVNAAVEAGKRAAETLGMLRAYHVIPRLHSETLKLFPTINKEVKENTDIPVNNSDFKVDEKFKREVIGTNKDSIIEKNKETQDNIKEKNKDIEDIKEESKTDITEHVEEIKKDIKEENKKGFKETTSKEVKENKIPKNYDDEKQKKDESALEENYKLKKQKDLLDYSSMRVDELRKLVTNLKLPHLTNNKIKFAKKDELIKILLEYGREDGK